MTAETDNLLTVAQAWQRLQDALPGIDLATESVSVTDAMGRILAEAPLAQVTSPPADASAMDGIAIQVADVQVGQRLECSQRIAAGSVPEPLRKGTAARIFTGALVPPGADCVIMQEHCTFDGNYVTVNELAPSGNNIRHRGGDIKPAARLLARGHEIRPQDLGLLITAGVSCVTVYVPLRVGVVATGDELQDISEPLQAGKIFESNSPMIAAWLRSMGCQATCYRVKDTLSATLATLQSALRENHAVITIGGVSVGEEDHVKSAVAELGSVEFWKIKLKPGKPFLFARVGNQPVIGLPGNPVSSFVTFGLFCRPFLNALRGADFRIPRSWLAIANFSMDKTSFRQQYLRGQIRRSSSGEMVVEAQDRQGSGLQQLLCQADVLIVVPPDRTIRQGQSVHVIPLGTFVR